MSETLNYQGHVYVDAGETPGPREGWEDGLVATQTEDGVPAWWEGGHLFVLDAGLSTDKSSMNNLPNLP